MSWAAKTHMCLLILLVAVHVATWVVQAKTWQMKIERIAAEGKR